MVDVDGVLVHGRLEDGRHWSTSLEADLGVSAEALRREFFDSHWNEIITGRAMLRDHLQAVLQKIAPHLTADQLISYWFATDACLDEKLLRDLIQLRSSGFQLHLATNQEHLRARYLWDELGLAAHFDSIQYSAQIGAKKPELEFFRTAASRTGLSPDEILLIDDSVENVQGAKIAGWKAVLWRAEKPLFEILKDIV
ncbi:HAD-IA family hydrolase [Microvirga arsenatis]|uniref:HAD-IA family hydrolase n=1 Tax=Microvirga arsenatis TaxID=2692265 RepID=A0ABW9YZ21_9HYPH|nr:HAD-IA family hydrolase [Microvirga arsenatis]NBJ25649.1 HAD-IA family hydrolase [Microvirga arsenatis]